MSKDFDENVKKNEECFQKALSLWSEFQDKKYWDSMFLCVNEACLNIAKSKCYKILVRDLEDKAMDATLDVMNKIKSGVKPKKLSSFCYLYTIGKVWNRKEQKWDRSEDINAFLNNKTYYDDFDKVYIEE